MSSNETENPEIAKWDPGVTKRVVGLFRLIVKWYFRSEVRGLELLPSGGVLVAANHSGGFLPMDPPVFAVDFYDTFGYDRPIYFLTHDIMLVGPTAELLGRIGFIHANRDNAATALRAGGRGPRLPGR